MKKLIIILISIILVACFGSWLSLHFEAKKKFDKARNEINTGILTREIMDAQARELLTIVRKNWTKHTSEVNGAHSVALKLAGKRPTVSNLVDLFTSRVPEYSFFSLSKNKESAIIASILATLMPITVDGTIHVSSDGSVALIQDSPNSVNIFTDESEGLREEWYYIKKEAPVVMPGKGATKKIKEQGKKAQEVKVKQSLSLLAKKKVEIKNTLLGSSVNEFNGIKWVFGDNKRLTLMSPDGRPLNIYHFEVDAEKGYLNLYKGIKE